MLELFVWIKYLMYVINRNIQIADTVIKSVKQRVDAKKIKNKKQLKYYKAVKYYKTI